MSGNRIERFDVAPESFGSPRVNEGAVSREIRGLVCGDGPIRGLFEVMVGGGGVARGDDRNVGFRSEPSFVPGFPSTVEDRNVADARRLQDTSSTRRTCSVPVVVHDDGRVLVHSPAAQGRLHCGTAAVRHSNADDDGAQSDFSECAVAGLSTSCLPNVEDTNIAGRGSARRSMTS
ncbi:hypothetical protein R3Q16_33215 [Rhodococcus globerulus]|uniref:Uncharacterized protein n=1 Tax=Rhodococcus globerulus TaxID=33008 RepID=A0ABU4C4N2_RHOGO|nr:hypothetical protein [Rhodococcus globerulus]MDV6271469.1 hypothetical protein [Rhodococcus globerulus]